METRKICEKCDGKKLIPKTDIKKARTIRVKCPKCKGVGYINEIDPNGVIRFHIPCQVIIWQKLDGGYPVSTLEVRLRMVTAEDGTPIRRNGKERFYIEIPRINTKPSHQRQGIMSTLLTAALYDKRIEWAETSWDDSTEEGRNFLLKRGFRKENEKLVWERI